MHHQLDQSFLSDRRGAGYRKQTTRSTTELQFYYLPEIVAHSSVLRRPEFGIVPDSAGLLAESASRHRKSQYLHDNRYYRVQSSDSIAGDVSISTVNVHNWHVGYLSGMRMKWPIAAISAR